jgi:hypothetical protein
VQALLHVRHRYAGSPAGITLHASPAPWGNLHGKPNRSDSRKEFFHEYTRSFPRSARRASIAELEARFEMEALRWSPEAVPSRTEVLRTFEF